MWDFSQCTSGEQAFKSLSWGSLDVAGAKIRVGARVQISRIALRIRSKLFLVFLEISIAIVGPRGPTDCLENFDLGGRKK